MESVVHYENVFSEEDFVYFFKDTQVVSAKAALDTRIRGSVYFTVQLPLRIKEKLQTAWNLDLTNVDNIPMRWIKGDTLPHIDRGIHTFENTYLAYLTNSPGDFLVGEHSYPIQQGSAYIFPEGLYHETKNTGTEPRLLLGPMSETGFAVGAGSILSGDGGTSVYIRADGGVNQYSYDQTTWNTLFFPCTVQNTNTSTGNFRIELLNDITFSTAYEYFIVGSEYIQFGSTSLNSYGSTPTILIDGVTGYNGLILNGNYTLPIDGYSYVYVMNLTVRATNGSTLASGAGWFGYENFGYNSTVNITNIYFLNCTSEGPINGDYSGGILGSGPVLNSSITLINCSSTGIISGRSAGGIVGYLAGGNGGNVSCISCWSTGAITGQSAGGIAGGNTGFYNQNVLIESCYSVGVISGQYAGGICGRYAKINLIQKCYSRGNISGTYSGGIVGSDADVTTITNCYTLGNINGLSSAGGIAGGTSDPIIITHCYTTGTTTSSRGYIVGNSSSVSATNYSEAYYSGSGWDTSHANTVLQGTPTSVVGSSWVASVLNDPYELRTMGYSQYDITNIQIASDGTANTTQTFASTIEQGASTAPPIITDASGNSYAILEITGGNSNSYETITIGQYSGIISTTDSTTLGTYTIFVRSDGYNIATYLLTVGEKANSSDGPCSCTIPLQLQGLDFTRRAEIISGNGILADLPTRRGPVSFSDLLKAKMAQASKRI